MNLKSHRFHLSIGAVALAVAFAFSLHNTLKPATAVHAAAAPSAACTFPTSFSNNDQTSWQIFVAASCPTGNPSAPLTWETWPTQEQVFASGGGLSAEALGSLGTSINTSTERFHRSVLAQVRHALESDQQLTFAPGSCSQTTAIDPYSGAQRKRTLCEEVRLNLPAARYVRQNRLNTLQGQGAFIQSGRTIDFPWSAIEVKADWEKDCTDTTLHREKIQKVTYCLVAMHIDSKLLPDWIWATFETLSVAENPARCYAIGCRDTFGFAPALVPSGYSSQAVRSTQTMTPQLNTLETSAGLEKEMAQYTMDGAQTQFVNSNGTPTLLGNSVTEAELAGVPLNAASCITCHQTSNVNRQGQQNLGPLAMDMVGNPPAIPGYAPRDLVWTFIIAK